ncbi:hypothetical protein M0R45_005563 [Rubus argutus]|uniref:U-box domain-containing protein n=1 Tax=Rubus argutus TaxID=59490 RepID=A0AAW1YN02_RUBAR
MGRDDLYITVPSFFRCPISLDVMKSPVSLCTGVTYDRASIQRWLDDGNNTCPATMQVLHSKDFVPNRTCTPHPDLVRLGPPPPSRLGHEQQQQQQQQQQLASGEDQVVDLIQQMDGHSSSIDSLSKIVRFAKESEENGSFSPKATASSSCSWKLSAAAMPDGAHGNNNIRILEQIVRIIELVIGEIQDNEVLMRLTLKKSGAGAGDCLASLLLLLQQGSAESRIASTRVFGIDRREISPARRGQVLVEAPVRLEFHDVDDREGPEAARNGVVREGRSGEDLRGGRGGRIRQVLPLGDRAGLLKVSSSATEHAGGGGESERVNERYLLLMQSNCSPCVRQMSADLLKMFRVNSKSAISCYDTKTTHIMPF